MKIKYEQQHHKNLTGGSPKQSTIDGSFCLSQLPIAREIKKPWFHVDATDYAANSQSKNPTMCVLK